MIKKNIPRCSLSQTTFRYLYVWNVHMLVVYVERLGRAGGGVTKSCLVQDVWEEEYSQR